MGADTKGNLPIPVPGIPMNVSIDPVELVNGILDCYKNVKINQEIQATERMRIREQAKICIAEIEADTKKFEMVLNQIGAERMVLIENICKLLNSNLLDDNSIKICELILGYLSQNNPLSALDNKTSKLSL